MKIEEIMELLGQAQAIIELIKVVRPVVQEVGSEVLPLLEGISDGIVDLKIRAYNRYVDDDFSHEDAMLLVMNSQFAIEEALKRKAN